MGMFDSVIADFKCPYCAYELSKEEMEMTRSEKDDTWQTKATLKLLDTYKIGDEPKFGNVKIKEGWMEVHHVCPKCKKFVDSEIEIKDYALSDKISYEKSN
ncbi:MAG: hypothetical protein A3D34_01500 [Candidatus Staskawiczbacteria bacterium RIFCSPHIGHO2_02_FULL_33_16]|uniref:Uncharacterized protein n=1 Tax=Candidatus Staskawiczbacteria bacterium RIFCSPHIGHO2_02_FULL_33_16 TaxID=1802204 RepID=A0A1G2HX01_9BACT|nr:MAG: hypothetical protein A3D34_01500 [Candidatus Staskawiczbacteria bacterium RIFCSPHIGHO2_02_FULL_33_16]